MIGYRWCSLGYHFLCYFYDHGYQPCMVTGPALEPIGWESQYDEPWLVIGQHSVQIYLVIGQSFYTLKVIGQLVLLFCLVIGRFFVMTWKAIGPLS
jgi:hypothetical protein